MWEYFSPDKHGLEQVGGIDWLRGEGNYEWDETTVLYHRETDTFYWETESGCSCDGPLMHVQSIADLQSGSFHDLTTHINAVWEEVKTEPWRGEDSDGTLALEVTRVIEAAIRIREGK